MITQANAIPLIQLDQVSYSIKLNSKQRLCVLNAVNLKVHKQEIVSIKGPSGSGKSSLLYIMSGLLNPSCGQVYYNQHVLNQLSITKKQTHFRQNIAFIYQDFQLLDDFTVYENLLLALSFNKRLTQSQKKQLILDNLSQLGLESRSNHLPKQLSGGEQQRIATLRAILKPANCIFCDEPTGNLDDKNAQKVYELLRIANKKFNKSIVIVSHQNTIHQLANRHYYLHNKALVESTH